MRWKSPTRGNIRIIKRFAIIPIEVKDEVRWLEWCYIKQEYCCGYCEGWWNSIKFVTEDDYERYKESLYNEHNTYSNN